MDTDKDETKLSSTVQKPITVWWVILFSTGASPICVHQCPSVVGRAFDSTAASDLGINHKSMLKSVEPSSDTERVRYTSVLILLCFLTVMATGSGCTSATPPCCRAQMGAEHQAPAEESASQYSPTGVDLQAPWRQDDGRALQLSSLHGHPVVISMFYATCEGVCVITKNDMKAIEASLPPEVARRTVFVLATLDPAHDSAAVLRKYRLAQGLAAERWRLLRGSAADTARLATALGIGFGRDKSGLFRHSSQLVVLDGAGRMVATQEGIQANLEAVVQALTLVAQR